MALRPYQPPISPTTLQRGRVWPVTLGVDYKAVNYPDFFPYFRVRGPLSETQPRDTSHSRATIPDCDLTGSQSQPAQCVAHLGTPALQTIVYTHDGESQAVLRRARQGRDAHPWWPRQLSGRRIGERADSLRPALGTSGMEGGFVTDRRVDQTETGLLFC